MPTINQLNQRHPSFDEGETSTLRALYCGGASFRKKLDIFLPARPFEPPNFYETRCNEAVYRNYVAPIIDHFTALLFSSRPVAVATKNGAPVLELDEFYDKFRGDCDHTGTDLDAVAKWLLTEAMVTQCGWVRIHHANDGGVPAETRLEFDDRGLGDCWLEPVDRETVLDWDTDEDGNLDWALLHGKSLKRRDLSDGHDWVTETWTHLLSDRVDVYRIEYPADKPPQPKTEVPKDLERSHSHRFGVVPLVCLDLPDGLWVANRLESPQLAHFRLSNAQQWGLFMTCYAMPVYNLLDPDPERFEKMKMGAGWGIVLGGEEKFNWMAPPSAPYEALGKAISEHKDEIFRIAQNMALGVENNAASVGRSAESKQADAQATKVVLLAYSRVVKECIERIYDIVSKVRGDEFEWSIEGLDDFAASDISSLVGVLTQVEASGGIPSKTFQVEMKSRVAESLLPDMSQATKQTVRAEIEEGVEDQSAAAREEREMKRMDRIGGALERESQQAKQEQDEQRSTTEQRAPNG